MVCLAQGQAECMEEGTTAMEMKPDQSSVLKRPDSVDEKTMQESAALEVRTNTKLKTAQEMGIFVGYACTSNTKCSANYANTNASIYVSILACI